MKEFSCVKTKANSNFAVKLTERSNRSLSDYMMNHLFQYVTMECIELN